jgi:AcrR family transcriptional regulator
MNTKSKHTGRRSGQTNTKVDIILVAQTLFSENGYEKVSLRSIARESDVDPALISHYFKSKQELFMESMLPLFEAPRRLTNELDVPRKEMGISLAKLFVSLISNEKSKKLLVGIIRSSTSDEQAAKMMNRFITENVASVIKQKINKEDASLYSNLIGSQFVGIVMAREIIKIEPLASLNEDDLIKYLAPKLQIYFN